MTSWENPVPVAVFLSSTDLETRSQSDSRNTPLIDGARSRTYDAVCTQLTTTKWMERWRSMCVISSDPDGERVEGSERHAETWRAHPVFELGEVTMTHLGVFFPFVRPGCILLTGEVHDSGSEEAEGVIVMISDWLELDASDSWVRHDSEIVSVPLRRVLDFGGRRLSLEIRPHLTHEPS